MKTIFMETTEIQATQTQAELQALLSASGATEIRTKFEDGQLVALAFAINIGGNVLPFALPCRWEPILNHLVRKARRPDREKLKQQAIRVAWRQLLRWAQAQLALVDTGMAKTEEVFLPYLQAPDGKTLFEAMEGKQFKMLGVGK